MSIGEDRYIKLCYCRGYGLFGLQSADICHIDGYFVYHCSDYLLSAYLHSCRDAESAVGWACPLDNVYHIFARSRVFADGDTHLHLEAHHILIVVACRNLWQHTCYRLPTLCLSDFDVVRGVLQLTVVADSRIFCLLQRERDDGSTLACPLPAWNYRSRHLCLSPKHHRRCCQRQYQ